MLLSWDIPPRLASLTIAFLGAAALWGYPLLQGSWDADAIREHGRDATAAITGFHATMGRRQDHTISYTIDLAWRDGSGAERRYGPTHISDAYAQQIAFNGVLVTRQTTIRYLEEEDRSARPIVVADADERAAQDGFGRTITAVLGVVGIAFAGMTAWRTRRVC
jgi:hypothetical protein